MKRKKTRRTYRLRNWKQYNNALVELGSLTLWVSDDILTLWRNHHKSGKRGKPRYYSDTAILCMATLQELYHLPLRATQGLMLSIVKLLGFDLSVPDYSVLCRRRRLLDVALPRRRQVFEDLLEQVEDEIEQVSGDGLIDKRNCYEAIRERKARAAIRPRRNAKIWQHGNSKSERVVRDENLRRIRAVGRKKWKRESGYDRRSLAETQMYRMKQIFEERVSARQFEGQAAQILVRCAAFNKMTHLGMPDSYAV